MPSFPQRFQGWVIRVGPNARAYGDPYTHAFFLSDSGEFVGQSTNPLTASAVRTAQEAGRTLLGFEPFWRHKRQENSMPDSSFCVSTKMTFTGEQTGIEYDTLEHANKGMSPEELIEFVSNTASEIIKVVASAAVANIKKGVTSGDIAPAS